MFSNTTFYLISTYLLGFTHEKVTSLVLILPLTRKMISSAICLFDAKRAVVGYWLKYMHLVRYDLTGDENSV